MTPLQTVFLDSKLVPNSLGAKEAKIGKGDGIEKAREKLVV